MKKQFLLVASTVLLISSQIIAQPWKTTGNNLIGGEILGSISGPFPLTIQNGAAQPINFRVNGNQWATINPIGAFGIGKNFNTPAFLVDVKGGDVNIDDAFGTATSSYRIGGLDVLKHLGDPNNIFVGVGAGSVTILGSGTHNTCVGFHSSILNTLGSDNTTVGNTLA